MSKVRYGIEWPDETSDVQIELEIAKKWRTAYRGADIDDPADHLLRACRMLFTPAEFAISPWTEQHAHDFTHEKCVVTWGCASCSKAQPLYSTVYTPRGKRTMGSLRVGDLVLGQDGLPTRVLKTNDVGDQEIYRVEFSDGAVVRCAGDHLWEVTPRRAGSRPAVVTAEWLSKHAKAGRYSVPVCGPALFTASGVPIDPYVMGALLGDGGLGGASGTGVIRFTSADLDIIAEFRSRLVPGYSLNPVSGGSPVDYCLVRDESRGRMPNYYIQALKEYGLWGKLSPEKFVPDAYLYNSEDVRRGVLSGLLDTDGLVRSEGTVEFSSASLVLAQNVVWLVESLGGYATVHTHPAGYTDPDRGYIKCLDAHRVTIHLADKRGLFRCGRKAARVRNDMRGSTRRYIKRVHNTGVLTHMRCITVDNPRGLYLTDGFVVTHNSNDYGLFTLLDWATDPYDTVWFVGSTTKDALKHRTWESILRYFNLLKRSNTFLVPGRHSKTGYAILCEDTDELGAAQDKAGIHGAAINDDGNIQGAHAKYVRLLIDELAAIKRLDVVEAARMNLSIGALDFRFFGLANPESRGDPSSYYSMPDHPDGWSSINVDMESWRSKFGLVRHHDGLKSPCVLNPALKDDYTFLLNRETLDERTKECSGTDSPVYWKMVRGFIPPQGSSLNVVLTEADADRGKVTHPIASGAASPMSGLSTAEVTTVFGVDPAWSEAGDGAVVQPVRLETEYGMPILNFLPPIYMAISASSSRPILYQLSDQVISLARQMDVPAEYIGVDTSGNQGLGDALDVELGPGCVHVNHSERASDAGLLKATDNRPPRELVYDTGTECWVTLAHYCRAGQVRGLDPKVVRQLTSRRFAIHPKSGALVHPMRLEAKKEFCDREKLGSPDECSAAALAAYVVRTVVGLTPGERSMPELKVSRILPVMAKSGNATNVLTPTYGVPQLPRIDFYAFPVDGWRRL